jgi:glycosyltransferase involved in cell wall biosynthesis
MTGKISCQMIVRDDEATLEAAILSVKPHIDELVIVDTGSVDRSPEIARKYADKFEVWLGCNDPVTGLIDDFAAARNHAASLGTCEWLFWLDADDVVSGAENLRKMTERTEDMVCYITPYAYDFDAAGRCTTLHHRERLVRPAHLWGWQTPVHEVLLPQRVEGTFWSGPSEQIAHIHHKHLSRKQFEPGRNLRILEKYIEKCGEGDIRALYYFGSELGKAGRLGESIRVLRRYAQLGNWTDEKCLALLALSSIQANIGDFDTAIDWSMKALVTKSWPEPYFQLARYFYSLAQERWIQPAQKEENIQKAVGFMKRGLAMPPTNTVLFSNPQEQYEIQRYLNVCLMMLGDLDGAIKSCQDGLVGLAGDPELSKNLEIFTQERSRRTVMVELRKLEAARVVTPETVQLVHGVFSGTFTIGGGQMAQASQPPAVGPDKLPPELEAATPDEGKLDIILYVGHQLEPWSPKTLVEGGMGGSETMAWELSKRLVALGHAVRMYSHATPSMEGVYEGVRYLDASRFKETTCDLLIASRQPWAVDRQYECKARARILWVHDVHCGEALTQERDLRFDRIFCLSDWHKAFFLTCYPTINPDKVIVTRNGVDMARFAAPEARAAHRAVYSSSPDRGLRELLEIWPTVTAAVPDAELSVFYGFDNWEKTVALMGDQDGTRKIQHLKHLVRTTPGVTLRGRVGGAELAKAFLSSGVFAYPTWFTETSCIAAMEAQSAGCRIVTSPHAGLVETVGERGVMVRGHACDPNTPATTEYKTEFAAAVIDAMKDPEGTDRAALQTYAREHFDMDLLAEDWSEMLLGIVADVDASVVPVFKGAA